jgi:hypothetical protein
VEWLICGTVPEECPCRLCRAAITAQGRQLSLENPEGSSRVSIARGSAALVAAYAVTADILGIAPPFVLLAGDDGGGEGSRRVYRFLHEQRIPPVRGIIFHYFWPDVDWHSRLLPRLESLVPKPLLCADAGFMYAAKMSGYAASYDLFFPDAGELAFLADEKAPHPFYTRGFLLSEDNDAPELAMRAYIHENAPAGMLVKGGTDYVIQKGQVAARVSLPSVPELEAIGGTGDTLAGIACALLCAGRPMRDALTRAALVNRRMGALARPTPAAGIADLLEFLPQALR